MNVLLSG